MAPVIPVRDLGQVRLSIDPIESNQHSTGNGEEREKVLHVELRLRRGLLGVKRIEMIELK